MLWKLKSNIIITTIITLLLDQASKHIIIVFFNQKQISLYKITSYLNFIKVWNKGISFGILHESNLSPVLLICTSFVILILILHLVKHINYIIQGMIIGGTLGNLVDRIIFGKVLDFIDFSILNYHYPTFNIADSFIVISMIFIAITEIKPSLKKS